MTWPFSTCQIIGCVLFSTAFEEDVVRRLESGEALATVWKELAGKQLLCEWRWAWRRSHGAAGLNRRRGPRRAEAKARIEELERLVGRQQLDLDFFRKALRFSRHASYGRKGLRQIVDLS